MTITIKVIDKRAGVIGAPIIVCGNSGYTIDFDFDAEWDGYVAKTARFVYAQGSELKYTDVAFTGSTVDVPILSNVREVYVGVYAGDLRTTTPARVPCDRSILCGGGVHEEPPEDVYNQILALCNEIAGASAAHLVNKNNPHGVTAEQIGAISKKATALGNKSIKEWAVSLNGTSYAFTNATTTDMPAGVSSSQKYAIVSATVIASGKWVELRATFILTGCVAVCIYNNGWGEWEWVNPPMIVEQEYRTTERFAGKPVYTKRIKHSLASSVGSSSGLVDETIAHGISNFGEIVRYSARKGNYPLPMVGGSGGIATVSQITASSIILRLYNYSMSAGDIYFYLYYTKTS